MLKRSLAAIPVVLAILLFGRFVFFSAASRRASVTQGRPAQLLPCPDRPNCVSSVDRDPARRVEPLSLAGSVDEALGQIETVLGDMQGARILEIGDGYVRAEFTSRIFRFVDDLELLYDQEAAVFQVRSASRVGYSDLGTNRRRVEDLRSRLAGLS